MSLLLQVKDLHVKYKGTSAALAGVSLDVPAGHASVVLGAKGAGKTSLLRGISGFWRTERGAVTSGRVSFDGRDITRMSPIETARLGIVIVPENPKVFGSATVADNLRSVPRMVSKPEYESLTETVIDLFPFLRQRMGQQAGYLSGGERQMLGIARGLLLKPRLLMIDEATLGLAPIAIDAVFGRLEHVIAKLGTTILLVEQNIGAAMRIAQFVHVMEAGRIVFQGTKEEMLASRSIQASYLGVPAL